MAHEGLNTLDPVVAKRWIEEFENGKRDEMTLVGRHRNERRQMKDRLKAVVDRAEGAGINRKAFLDELTERELKRKIDALAACDDEEQAEQKELLKQALGGLPLGDWGVDQMAGAPPSGRKRSAAVPGAKPAAPDAPLTLDEAKEILARPKGKGRPSAAALAQRAAAQKIVDEANREIAVDTGLMDGASGEKAEAIADAMEASEGNVTDLRPRFMRPDPGAPTPPEAA